MMKLLFVVLISCFIAVYLAENTATVRKEIRQMSSVELDNYFAALWYK